MREDGLYVEISKLWGNWEGGVSSWNGRCFFSGVFEKIEIDISLCMCNLLDSSKTISIRFCKCQVLILFKLLRLGNLFYKLEAVENVIVVTRIIVAAYICTRSYTTFDCLKILWAYCVINCCWGIIVLLNKENKDRNIQLLLINIFLYYYLISSRLLFTYGYFNFFFPTDNQTR